MNETNTAEKAREIYEALCSAIDRHGWSYTRDEDQLLVHFGVQGEDIPMSFVLAVDADRQIVRLISLMPFRMKEDRRVDGAIITCAATRQLVNGSFDYDFANGSISFRMTASYRESAIGEGLFLYMIDSACESVDRFNDKFAAVNSGMLSVEDFLQSL